MSLTYAREARSSFKAGGSKGFELESAELVTPLSNARLFWQNRRSPRRKMPPGMYEFLWSLGDFMWNVFANGFVVMDD